MKKSSFVLGLILLNVSLSESVHAQEPAVSTNPSSTTASGSYLPSYAPPRASRSNPAIGVNALVLGRTGDAGSDPVGEAANGFSLQEVEFRYSANVDAYFRGEMMVALEKEPGEDFALEPEEVYAETLGIPSLNIRAGKFFAIFGRHNSMHTHIFPFIDAPLTNQTLLGEEGINQIGLAASALLPLSWFSELTLQGFSPDNERLFRTTSANALVGIYQWKNLWDLSDAASLEFTSAFGHGKNDFGSTSKIYNLGLTYKWRPTVSGQQTSFSFTTEYLRTNVSGAAADEDVGGIAAWAQYQFSQRYWLQGRTEYLGLPKLDAGVSRRYSGLLGYVLTEYSALRLQYDHIRLAGVSENENRLSLQMNVGLGSHPAHAY